MLLKPQTAEIQFVPIGPSQNEYSDPANSQRGEGKIDLIYSKEAEKLRDRNRTSVKNKRRHNFNRHRLHGLCLERSPAVCRKIDRKTSIKRTSKNHSLCIFANSTESVTPQNYSLDPVKTLKAILIVIQYRKVLSYLPLVAYLTFIYHISYIIRTV